MADTAAELSLKLDLLRAALDANGLAAIRLRGRDWFAWATCGGSNAVLSATDTGIAEVLVTRSGTSVLTNAIEAERLRAEELIEGLDVVAFPWAAPAEREAYVGETAGDGRVASDVPVGDELPLPASLVDAKRRLLPTEIDRYRSVGRSAAEAMTEVLAQVETAMTEFEVAALGAAALLRRGVEPALILVAGSRRMDLYRHATPTDEPIGERVGVVFCGRRHGLFANLTRFAYFRRRTATERRAMSDVAQVEAAAFAATRPGATLGAAFGEITEAYARLGQPGAELGHHQGGTTGYLSREVVATPGDPTVLVSPVAVAWNPSLPGAKIEDTVVLDVDGRLEVLTVDPAWPTLEVAGRRRPDVLVRG